MNVRQILVSAIGLALAVAGLAACGQKGPLYLPTDPAAKDRATLPQILTPGRNTTESTGNTK
jgi:predicted small lipoprotein YifL